MKKSKQMKSFFLPLLLLFLIVLNCGKVPIKKFYIINYEPEPLYNKKNPNPYPYTVRIKNFDIERAYAKKQLVYRKSPYELQYDFYREWAIKPSVMIADIVQKHFARTGLVNYVTRRLDAGASPDFELSGSIEAIEEYDSEEIWFAHLAIRIILTRIKDNKTLYNRRFDKRKKVHQRNPEFVVSVLSQIMDFITTQTLHDIDAVLAQEYELHSVPKIKNSIEPLLKKDSLNRGDRIE